jgi:hypothetical protein
MKIRKLFSLDIHDLDLEIESGVVKNDTINLIRRNLEVGRADYPDQRFPERALRCEVCRHCHQYDREGREQAPHAVL